MEFSKRREGSEGGESAKGAYFPSFSLKRAVMIALQSSSWDGVIGDASFFGFKGRGTDMVNVEGLEREVASLEQESDEGV